MINVINFSNIEIDGVNVGDCISASANYPDKAADILVALNAYDAQRQGQADAAALATAVEAHTQQIAELQTRMGAAQQTIAQQQAELSRYVIKDWDELMSDLKAVGFNRWLGAAGNTNPDLLDEVARLYAAAKEGNRKAVIDEYLAIATQYPPSIEERTEWQAVLDSAKYKIPRSLLSFTGEMEDDSN